MTGPFKYLAGPVLSRRLGRSLGVDLLQGECTFLCPYCEVRVRHVEDLRLFEFKNTAALYDEYARFCAGAGPANLDSVTFSGTGEPTLVSNLGDILRHFQTIGPFPLTVITNGSLLWNETVRENLRPASLVVPSLDAVTESAWRRVNRPHPGLTLDQYLDGTKRFCRDHPGQIWLEILLVRGVNDGTADIAALGKFIRDLRVTRVQIGSVDRPPARSRAAPVPPARLRQIATRIRKLSGRPVDLMCRAVPPRRRRAAGFGLTAIRNLTEHVLRSVRLRPQTRVELRRMLDVSKPELDGVIRNLQSAGRLCLKRQGRRVFLQAA